jgi:hypothetical protein
VEVLLRLVQQTLLVLYDIQYDGTEVDDYIVLNILLHLDDDQLKLFLTDQLFMNQHDTVLMQV